MSTRTNFRANSDANSDANCDGQTVSLIEFEFASKHSMLLSNN